MLRREVDVFVGLGANLPLGQQAPEATLLWAMQELAQQAVWHVQQVSSLYRSAAWQADGPDYINAVAQLRTPLTAPEVLARLQGIENQASRQRPYHHAPRTLDLDLLLYGDGHIQSLALTVPHPRMRERAFVLRPLAEIAPERVLGAWLDATQAQDAWVIAAPPALIGRTSSGTTS